MKKGKNKGVRRLREPSLKKMLLKYGTRGVLRAVIFCLLATGIFAKWTMHSACQNITDICDSTLDNVSNYKSKYYEQAASKKNAYATYRGSMSWNLKCRSFQLLPYPYWDFAAVIVAKEDDNWNIIYDSQQAVATHFKSDSDGSFFSFASYEENDEQREIKKLIESQNYSVEMESCYIDRADSSRYQPGIIKVYHRNWEEEVSEQGEAKIYKTLDYTPQSLSGYQYLDLKEGKWRTGVSNIVVGSDKESASLMSLKNNLSDYINDEGNENNSDFVVSQYFFKDSKIVYKASDLQVLEKSKNIIDINERENAPYEGGIIPLSEDEGLSYEAAPSIKSAYLLIEVRYNLWKQFRTGILLTWLVVIILFLVCSLLIAHQRYHRYKLKWEKEQYRTTLMNTMAHDLKSPLMVLSGYAENLKELLGDSEEKQRHYVNSIMDNVQYMNTMIGDIIELSKLEQTQEEGEKEEVELSVLVREIMKRYQDILASKQIEVTITGEAVKRVEKRAMLRVIDNILSNAVCYTPNGEQIVITMNEEFLEIRNTGVTVSREFCHDAFLPFVKGDSARGNEQGNGLGLAIVRELLKQCNMSCEMQAGENEVRVVVYF